ncbi:hypothetical protein [Paraliobacillus ryukyuensis]|uniref:hypothetical protein n=1 Tax=Paraliobacillus ryukyuensis TaxID=200904 RepID=UPI0009A5A5F5|nr:hypothetical protein [Paraliobacillus ryukyuensis]
MRILFQRQADQPSAVELLFEDVMQLHTIPCASNEDAIIYDAKLWILEGLFYWTDDADWNPTKATEVMHS